MLEAQRLKKKRVESSFLYWEKETLRSSRSGASREKASLKEVRFLCLLLLLLTKKRDDSKRRRLESSLPERSPKFPKTSADKRTKERRRKKWNETPIRFIREKNSSHPPQSYIQPDNCTCPYIRRDTRGSVCIIHPRTRTTWPCVDIHMHTVHGVQDLWQF